MTLKIKNEDLKKIINHCLEASPEECCGLLIGRKIQDEIIIEKVKITKNIYPYDKRVGYVVDPLEYLDAEREAEREKLEVVGVYHSHIGLQPSPSMRDLEQAIPGYIYLIISVSYTPTFKAWILEEEKKTFKEEKIEII